MDIFVSVLENEIKPISQTKINCLSIQFPRVEKSPPLSNASCSAEGIVYHLVATYILVASNTVATFKHYLVLELTVVTRY